MTKIVVTAAFPFIPAEITIAHIASTYLPADIFNRFMLLDGKESLLISATDVHGSWIKREMQETQKSQEEITEKWHQKYQQVFKRFNIHFDRYSRTDVPMLQSLAHKSLNQLHKKGLIYKKKTESYFCSECLENLPRRFRAKSTEHTRTGKEKVGYLPHEEEDATCVFCHGKSIEKHVGDHWFLDLNKGIDAIKHLIEKQQNRNIKNYLNSLLEKDLPHWNFTRENYIGIPIPFDANLSLYLWYESLLGYLSTLGPNEDVSQVTFHHFMGKNIVYYHGIVWPVLLQHGLDLTPRDILLTARGFLDLSQTDEALFQDIFIERYPMDYWRFFLAYQTPDSICDFSYKQTDFAMVTNQILCNQIGSFLARCTTLFSRFSFQKILAKANLHPMIFDFRSEIRESMQQYEIRKSLILIQKYVKNCGEYIEQNQLYHSATEEQLGTLASLMYGCLLFLKPYLPELVKSFNIFENDCLERFENIHRLANVRLLPNTTRWEKVKI